MHFNDSLVIGRKSEEDNVMRKVKLPQKLLVSCGKLWAIDDEMMRGTSASLAVVPKP